MSDQRRECDVVVLGGGPAGIATACVAAERGCRVVLLEATPWLGGPIWRSRRRAALPRGAQTWLRRLAQASVEVLDETTAFAVSAPHVLHVQRRQEPMEIHWQRLVLATGSHELFLPFPGWTLPNVVGAGGLQLLTKTGWPLRGKRVVVAGSGPLLFAVAAQLARAGAKVSEILEQASLRRVARFALALPRLAPGKIVQAVGFQRSLMRVRYRSGCWPVAAHGEGRVQGVTFTNGTRTWTRECDYLACAFGLVPSLQWPLLLDCQVANDAVVVDSRQQTSVRDVYAAGEVTGIGGVEAALLEGEIAGSAASGEEQQVRRLATARQKTERFALAIRTAFRLRDELKELIDDQTIVCRCEDVTWGQIRTHGDVKSAKLHTRCGMGPCQGRICHAVLRHQKGWGGDTVRPPVLPVTVGTLMGGDGHAEERVV